MTTTNRFTTPALFILLGFSVLGCNSEERRHRGAPFDPQRSTISCNTYYAEREFCGSCARGSTLEEMCSWVGGNMIDSGVCQCRERIVLQNWTVNTNDPAWLNPDSPAGYESYRISAPLKKGETLHIEASGHWGDDYDFGFPPKCNDLQADVNGYDGDVGPLLNDGKHLGLLISDGIEVYEAGSNANITIKNNGSLRFGFNIPNGDAACEILKIKTLSVSHCVNQNNEVTPCP